MNNEKILRLRPDCLVCLAKRYLEKYPKDISEEKKLEYIRRVFKMISEAPDDVAAPVITRDVGDLCEEMFGARENHMEDNIYFNNLIMGMENELTEKIENSSDALLMALRYAMVGNYIDFNAFKNVEESFLRESLDKAATYAADLALWPKLKEEILTKKTLVYLTDNCGELVLDKLFIKQIQKANPSLDITVIVKGADYSNDASLCDAKQVGLDKIVRVVDNGNNVTGTWLPETKAEALAYIDSADFIISKGQANWETLTCLGYNIYYIMLTKCDMIAEKMGVKKLTGVLRHD